MPGPKPKPTALKLIKGVAKDRINHAEPKPKQAARVPSPPSTLGKLAKAEWRRVAKQLHDTGILTLIDTKTLANYCQAYEDMEVARGYLAAWNIQNPDQKNVQKSMTGNIKTHPYVDQIRQHRADMNRFAAEFGLTPSSRSRVTVKGQTKGSKFDEF